MNRRIQIYPPKSFIPNKIIIKGSKPNRNLLVTPNGYTFSQDLVQLMPSFNNVTTMQYPPMY